MSTILVRVKILTDALPSVASVWIRACDRLSNNGEYIANILPILVIFWKEITKHFECDIFKVFYIQKTYLYVIAYLRCP
jgi:hypothetical protein